MKANKIISFITLIVLLITMMFSVSPAYASGDILEYTLTGGEGVADGTVTLTVDDSSDIGYVKLWWGKSSTEKLEKYEALAYLNCSGALEDVKETKINFENNVMTYTLSGGRLLPDGATHILAEIIRGSETTTVAQEIPAENRFNASGLKYKVIVTSDIHIDFRSSFENSHWRKGLSGINEYIKNSAVKPSAMVINGDLSDGSLEHEYAELENLLEEYVYSENVPVYYNVGNHDSTMIHGYQAMDNAIEEHFNVLENQGYNITRDGKYSYDVWINNEHHIFLAYPSPENTPNLEDSFKAPQIDWLEEKLSEGEKSGAKTYLYIHYPVYDTVTRSSMTTFNNINDPDFNAIIARHPNTVVFTSHVHNDYNTVMKNFVVGKDSASYADTSALTYNTAVNTDYSESSVKTSGGQGRILEVYEDKVVLRAMNFVNRLYVPRAECIIPIETSKNIGNVSVSADNLNEGTVVTAMLNNTAVDTNAYNIEWYVGGTKQEGQSGNTFTIVSAGKQVAVKIIDKTDTSKYAFACTDIREEYVFEQEQTAEDSVQITGADIEYANGIVSVKGSFTAADRDKKVLLMLIPKATYTQPETAVYINDGIVRWDGSYEFKFRTGEINLSGDDYVMLVKLDGEPVSASNLIEKVNGNELVEVELEWKSVNGKIVKMMLKNRWLDDTKGVQIVVAEYDENNNLINVTLSDMDIEFGRSQNEILSGISTTNKTRVFLWKDTTSAEPIAPDAEVPET